MVTNTYVLARIEAIERELNELRKQLAKPTAVVRKRKSLYGILGGVSFSEEEIDKTKRSLLRDVDAMGRVETAW